MIERLRAKGLIYEGMLEPPKGKTPDDWEPREQTAVPRHRSSATTWTGRCANPTAATRISPTTSPTTPTRSRAARDVMIDVWGADHGGYVSRMKAAVQGARRRHAGSRAVPDRACAEGRRSRCACRKRAGTYVTLRDLIDEVGRDAVRFTMLTRKSDAQMEFDIDRRWRRRATTRCSTCSTRTPAAAACCAPRPRCSAPTAVTDAALAAVPLDSLADEAELAVIRRLAAWPRTVEAAALAREPHRIAFFLYDLAGDFHMLWNRGRTMPRCGSCSRTAWRRHVARLALVAATAIVIRSGLAVMGVTPVEEMR